MVITSSPEMIDIKKNRERDIQEISENLLSNAMRLSKRDQRKKKCERRQKEREREKKNQNCNLHFISAKKD